MGVINVTPDSFSGDGIVGKIEMIVHRATEMVKDGADILDIGGESTRPGFSTVSVEEEVRRVVPAIEAIHSRMQVPISVDTTKVDVAARALRAGASIVNDVSGLHNADMVEMVAQAGAGLILVHNGSLHRREDLVARVVDDLAMRLDLAMTAGIIKNALLIDPGLGMGKDWLDNFEIMRRLAELQSIGPRVLVGPSRKGMIGRVLGTDPMDRIEGTVALASLCIANGANVIRVHDVRQMVRVARMLDSIIGADR